MVVDDTGIQKKFSRYLVIESGAGILLLLSAYYGQVVLQPLTILSLIACMAIQFDLMKHPAYGIINLAYLSTSGVLFYFFAESGFPPNFIFFGIVGVFMVNKLKLTEGPVITILLMLLFAYTNSLFNTYSSYSSMADRSSVLNFLFPVALFVFIVSTLEQSAQIHRMYNAIFWAICISSADFLLTYLNGPFNINPDFQDSDRDTFTKVSGISNHVNQLAAFVVFIIPIMLAELKMKLTEHKKLHITALLFLGTMLLYMSSRAAVGITAVYFIYKIIFSSRFSLQVKSTLTVLLVSGYIAAVAFDLPIIKKIQLKGDTGDEIRISKIDEALSILSEHPFLGVGLNNYVKYAGEHFSSNFNTHNTLLSVSAEQGLIGILLFLLLYFTPFIHTRIYQKMYEPEQRLHNLAVLESCALIFLVFFTDHLQGNAVYYILLATAIRSTIPLSHEQRD